MNNTLWNYIGTPALAALGFGLGMYMLNIVPFLHFPLEVVITATFYWFLGAVAGYYSGRRDT